MKRIEEQTYYEILEVNPNATPKEIQLAYDRARETFHSDSVAVYSLFSEEEMKGVQSLIEEAYRVLIDENLRGRYDQSHDGNWERPREFQGTSWDKTPLSFTGLSLQNGQDYGGKVLREIRERLGVDLKSISVETKINVKILEWIEEEALEKLPALVYLKGFLKGYAQFLGMDPQKVTDGYLKLLSGNQEK